MDGISPLIAGSDECTAAYSGTVRLLRKYTLGPLKGSPDIDRVAISNDNKVTPEQPRE
jgi:hypothetical protein